MPDVFLTGGSGFVGGALLRRLVADQREVAALVRSPEAATRVTGMGAATVRGDLADEAALRSGMEGCRTVFHVAGHNALCLRDRSVLEKSNVAGTAAVVRAAAAAGVERVVYTSSAAVIGERRGVVANERTLHRGYYLTAYERSKRRAEIVAFEQAERLGVELVAVNPSSVKAPGRTGGTANLLIAYLRGRLRYAVDATISTVYIGDVVAAHLFAERVGEPGRRYLASGWTTTVRRALERLGSAVGVHHRPRFVPSWTLVPAGRVIGGLWRLAGKDAPVCSEMVRALRHGHRYDGGLVEREWGLRYTDPNEWLGETVAWYREQGIV